jgi:HK97 family phage major capsid protein
MTTPYIGRDDALAFIVEQRSPEIIQMATQQSVAMQTFRQIPIGTSTLRLSLANTFPNAQWLVATPPADVDIAEKPVTEMSWSTQDVLIEEAATVVVIPENVLDDAEINLWNEVQTKAAEAVACLIDQAVFFGTAPAPSPFPPSFPVGGIVGQAVAKNHDYVWGTNDAAEDLAEAWNQTMTLVEEDGYDVNQSYAARGLRGSLRGLRDANGTPLYVTNLAGGGPTDSMYGVPINYVTNGTWDPTKALAVMGDPQKAVIALRQRLTAKRLDQAVVGDINLPMQDALGLRLKIRLGFTVLAPKGRGQSATPFPFAVLAPKAP